MAEGLQAEVLGSAVLGNRADVVRAAIVLRLSGPLEAQPPCSSNSLIEIELRFGASL